MQVQCRERCGIAARNVRFDLYSVPLYNTHRLFLPVLRLSVDNAAVLQLPREILFIGKPPQKYTGNVFSRQNRISGTANVCKYRRWSLLEVRRSGEV
jgi:hypothetical protein